MTAQDQHSRAEFERERVRHFKPGGPIANALERYADGGYVDRRTEFAWAIWQAARALPAGMEPVAWTLTATLDNRETTTTAHLWFSDPVNCMWTGLFTAAQVQAMSRVMPEPTSKQIVLMAGAILHQAHGTADTRHPGWAQAVEQAERAYRALVSA